MDCQYLSGLCCIWQRSNIAGLKKQIVNKILEKEMGYHIGYEKHSKKPKESDNRRNGNYEKTLIDPEGRKLIVEVPRG